MKRWFVLMTLIFILVSGCGQIKIKTSEQKTKEQIKIAQNDEVKISHEIKDKSDIKSLFEEDNYSLEIKQMGGAFLKAGSYFADRLLEILSRDEEPEWRDSTIDHYQIVLKFRGYKEIHVNTELESFWFKGEDKLYHAKGIKDLWKRYIIKLIDDQPTYTAFEKTVFTEIERDINRNGENDRVLLFYDGDIRLRVNDTEMVIEQGQGKRILFQSGRQYFGHPSPSVNLEYIDNLDLLVYTHESYDVHGLYQKVHFYKYDEGKIHQIWSDSDIDCELQAIDLEEGTMEIKFPFANKTYEVKLNQDELERNQQILAEYKENEKESNYDPMEHLKSSITSEGEQIRFVDYDGDGELELLVLGVVRPMKGAMPPRVGQIHDRIIYIFDLFPSHIQCIDILMERDANDSNSPFRYFEK